MNGNEPFKIEKPRLLLVEGPDDEGFFQSLARKLGVLDTIQVVNLKGRDNLEGRLKAVVAPNTTEKGEVIEMLSIGIVLDGEEDPRGTFQKICHALDMAALAVPSDPLKPAGTKPQCACMILPDLTVGGMLEDLCLQAFESDSAMSCVKEYFACLSKENALSSYNDLSKAKVRAFLSSKPRAETRLGIAAQQSWWPWDHPAFDQAKTFLQQIASI